MQFEKEIGKLLLGTEPSRDEKRTLGIRDRQILYRNAKGRCENPACNKKIEFDEMLVGHKTAYSKGGKTNFNNCICLCHRCNKLQGTDSWATFLKKQHVKSTTTKKTTTKKTTPKKTATKKTATKKTQRPKKPEDIGAMIQKDVERMLKGL